MGPTPRAPAAADILFFSYVFQSRILSSERCMNSLMVLDSLSGSLEPSLPTEDPRISLPTDLRSPFEFLLERSKNGLLGNLMGSVTVSYISSSTKILLLLFSMPADILFPMFSSSGTVFSLRVNLSTPFSFEYVQYPDELFDVVDVELDPLELLLTKVGGEATPLSGVVGGLLSCDCLLLFPKNLLLNGLFVVADSLSKVGSNADLGLCSPKRPKDRGSSGFVTPLEDGKDAAVPGAEGGLPFFCPLVATSASSIAENDPAALDYVSACPLQSATLSIPLGSLTRGCLPFPSCTHSFTNYGRRPTDSPFLAAQDVRSPVVLKAAAFANIPIRKQVARGRTRKRNLLRNFPPPGAETRTDGRTIDFGSTDSSD